MGWTAAVLAGSRSGRDPLAKAFGTDLKALVEVGGRPMVRWPVEALLSSDRFSSVVVLAQEPARIAEVLPAHPNLTVRQSAATIAETVEELLFDGTAGWPLLVTTADHVLLDAGMIDEFCNLAEGADLSIGVVERANLMARLPGSARTWIPFRAGSYSGANLFLLSGPKVLPAIEIWRSVEQDRKKVWALLRSLGLAVFLAAFLRLRTIHETLDRIGRRFGFKAQAIDMSDPLAAVDVDKLEDHGLVEELLRERQ